MTYRQMITNEIGEPLGWDYSYDDEPDPDDFYDRDYVDYDEEEFMNESERVYDELPAARFWEIDFCNAEAINSLSREQFDSL